MATPPQQARRQPAQRVNRSVPPNTPITVRQAVASGFTSSELRASRWSTPIHGVRSEAHVEPLETLRALSLVLGPGVAFSHITALRLLGVEVPWRLDRDERVHTVATCRSRRTQRHGVVAHHSTQRRLETVLCGGLPVTSPAQTWVHLVTALRPDELVVLGDAMLRREAAVTTIGELRRLAGATRKVKGIVAARSCLDRVRERTDSSMETRLRLTLVDAGFPCPEVNRPLVDGSGRFVALPDMTYPGLRIAIEYDGDVHRTDRATWRRDVRRVRAMESLGWIVIRAMADDIANPSGFLRRVRQAFGGR